MQLQQIEKALNRHPFHVIQTRDRAHAAVAIILEEKVDGVNVLFIERSTTEMDPWSGHIGFPGGKVELSDRSPRDAAEREVMEEVGIQPSQSRYLGRVSDIAPAGLDIVISGFVYAVSSTLPLQPDPHEVAKTFWLPLIEMANPLHRWHVEYNWHDRMRRFPALDLFEENAKPIWGITYRMLRNFYKAMAPALNEQAGGMANGHDPYKKSK